MRLSCFYFPEAFKFSSSWRLRALLFIAIFGNVNLVFSQVQYINVASLLGIDHFVNPHPFAQQRLGGAAWIDYDNDGWEDLYLPGGGNGDKLYRNNLGVSFSDVSTVSNVESATDGIITMGVSVGDVDRNGFQDLFVTTDFSHHNLLFLNNGDGTFTEQAEISGIDDIAFSFGASFGDYNQDGWLDLYVANWLDNPILELAYPDRLYLNDGDGTFTDVTQSIGLFSNKGAGVACTFSDFDQDNDVDLMLGNDYGFLGWTDENRLYQNDNGSLSDIAGSTGFDQEIFGFGIVSGDYDEDQDFDYYLPTIGSNLLLNNDNGQFVDMAPQAGVQSRWNVIDTIVAGIVFTQGISWGAAMIDYDNDSYLDIFVSNGRLSLPGEEQVFIDENRLFRNLSASGVFEDVSVVTGMDNGINNKGCAVADYDKDGDLDIVIVTSDTVGGLTRTQLMQNVGGNASNWLQIALVGTVSNFDAIGTVVRLYVDGRILIRDVDSGGGSYLSHHSKIVHYGLDDYESVDSVAIVWPNGGEEVYQNLSVNQRIEIVEGQGIITRINERVQSGYCIYPNPATDVLNIQGITDVPNYTLYNSYGTLVQSGILYSTNSRIDLRFVPAGSYYLRLSSNHSTEVVKVHVLK